MKRQMGFADRYKRDGERWRYVYLLERELERRSIRRSVVLAAFGLNLLLIALLVAQHFSN